MKPVPQELVDALVRGDEVRCVGHYGRRSTASYSVLPRPPIAHFYCAQCQEPRCGLCIAQGACVVCRALVRSTGAILLATKENPFA